MGEQQVLAEHLAVAAHPAIHGGAGKLGTQLLQLVGDGERHQPGAGRQHLVAELARHLVAETAGAEGASGSPDYGLTTKAGVGFTLRLLILQLPASD